MLPPQSARRLPLGSRVEVTIDSLAAGGDGVARVDGCVVFVPESAPLDRALVEIVALGPNHVRARIVELREPSPHRRGPACAHFGSCGGCTWQHVSIEAQRAAKVEIVRSALTRIGGIAAPPPIEMIGLDGYGWRARAMMRVVHAQRVRRVGFQRAHSREVEPIDDCPVLVESLRTELGRLRDAPESIPKTAQRLHLAAGDLHVRSVFTNEEADAVGGRSADTLVEQSIRGLAYAFDATTFFQGHRALIERLVDEAVADARGESALDLYCGAGLFTLPLARRFERVVGVEGHPRSIELARRNAAHNGIANAQFECRAVEACFALEALSEGVDFVLLDPPRAGVGEIVVERIAGLAPRKVHYVSCDPATLARDLKAFRAHGFGVVSIVALDLFPQTPHVECVVRMQRGD
ncbi:MAG: class I SAM-dependent RNA methyltransferase [Planctomycetota bacterium]|nr:class I SAM-dependent RNA methyltransferase [Planctomycetota bacterium]